MMSAEIKSSILSVVSLIVVVLYVMALTQYCLVFDSLLNVSSVAPKTQSYKIFLTEISPFLFQINLYEDIKFTFC